ncbi:unnamed protein product [Rotaria sp. Silwood1]|nr:unnamed protein product [Rotaria sp. Silwood1]CAF3847264.1 unnamed protein product [Rotaria sp. Silwood1]CAF4012288.1 unnamed protein product [Rotaria sp. Silwood1]
MFDQSTSSTYLSLNEKIIQFQQQTRCYSNTKRPTKKCAFDINSLLKPTPMNSSYIDDTEDGSSDDGHVQLSSSFESKQSIVENLNPKIKSKRIRTIFTTEQLDRLEIEFQKQQYMVGNERLYLVQLLNLSEAQVKI